MTVMRRHLPAAASGVAFGEVFPPELTRGHAAPEREAAIAIVGHQIIVRLGLNRNGSERFVAHARHMKMAFALAIEVLLAQIGVPALEHQTKKAQLVFLGERGHTIVDLTTAVASRQSREFARMKCP